MDKTQSAISVGYSNHTEGANGLVIQAECLGNPNLSCIEANVFAVGCYLKEMDIVNNFVLQVWKNTGTVAVPAWTEEVIGETRTVKITASSAEILAMFATPKAIVAAPGAGKTIELISAFGRMNFAGAAYATNVGLNIGFAAANDPLADNQTLLAATAGAPIQPFFKTLAGAVTGNNNLYVANAPLNLSVAVGNPVTGGGSLDVYVTYKVVTLG